jgi:hypothetical protein
MSHRKLIILALALCGCIAQAQKPRYPGHEAVLRLGAARDARSLAALRDGYLPIATPDQQYVIYLASRVASPGQFTNEFVESFPDKQGGAQLAGVDVDQYMLDPPLYEFYIAGQLAAIAESGHEQAIRKLLNMATWVDGAWAEIIYSGVVQCLIKVPEPTLLGLSNLEPEVRRRLLNSAFGLDLQDEDIPKLLGAVRSASTAVPTVASEVEHATVAESRRRGL